jgi:hypothetical protein
VFHLKLSPNYYTRTPSAQNHETNGNIEFLQPYPVVTADVLLEIGTAVISAVVSLLVNIRIAKCFTNSSKRFRCKVMFENEHTTCS